MSDGGAVYATDSRGQRERPFLFPWNRRLRHLQGISIRNLNVTTTKTRVRGKTIADDDVPYTLKTLAKSLGQGESKGLQQSRSFTDLTSAHKEPPRTPQKSMLNHEIGSLSTGRPGMGTLRRRSTLHWSGASPRARQHKLEEVAASRMADVWFSVHCPDSAQPVYISEVMEKSMNPSFRFFDLDKCGPSVTRLDELRLKVWAKPERLTEYMLLIQLDLNLQSLQFIGRTLENFHHPLPQNCILFHLSDGIYTSFTDMPVEDHGQTYLPRETKSTVVQLSSSYDALMQLANLDECIQDALKTRRTLESDINSLLAKTNDNRKLQTRQSQNQEQLATTDQAISTVSKQVHQLAKRRDDIRKSIQLRRDAISSLDSTQESTLALCESLKTQTIQLKTNNSEATVTATGQIRRITEDLQLIYPIEPVKNRPLQFTIRCLHLPNSNFSDTNRDIIAAALGMTAHLTHLLSLYLSTPLPYPIDLNTGAASIRDPISLALAQRRFPLFPVNVAYKFEYAVFLLNKDIEFLMNKAGLRMLDIRHTLPNLKYLTYVLTARTGELPARKAGGIRGLMPSGSFGSGRFSSPLGSRRSSMDSQRSVQSGNTDLIPTGREGGTPLTTSNAGAAANTLPVPVKKLDNSMRGPGTGILDLDDPFVSSSSSPKSAMGSSGTSSGAGLPYRKSLLRG